MKSAIRFLILLFLNMGFKPGYSQNDDCINAITIIPTTNCTTITGSMSGATNIAAPQCAPNSVQDVWYKFTASYPCISITVNPKFNLDHGFEIISGNCNGNSKVCVNNNGKGLGEYYYGQDFTIGETYYVRIFNVSGISSTNFSFCIQHYPTPQNDSCHNAIELTPSGLCNHIYSSFSGSTPSGNPPLCSPNSKQDVWYRFVATSTRMSVNVTTDITRPDIGFEIVPDNCGGSVVTCLNDNGIGGDEFYFAPDFIVGKTYYIRVFNDSGILTSSVGVCVREHITPPNDSCHNATIINPTPNYSPITGSFNGAYFENSAAPTCAPNSKQDLWYSFTANQPCMTITLESLSGWLNVGFEIFQGNCNGSSIACVNNKNNSLSEIYTSSSFIVGETYYVRVFNVNGYSTDSFKFNVQYFTPPENNNCSDAVNLTPSINCNPITGSFTGTSISNSPPTCAQNSQQDIWYSFTANQVSMAIKLSTNAGIDVGFEIFEGNCSNTSMFCINEFGKGIDETILMNNLSIGQTYFVRVFNVSGYVTGTFTICVQAFPVPTNNSCITATELSISELCNPTSGNFSGSTLNSSDTLCASDAIQDLWYKFTATTSALTITLSALNGVNHGFEILSGSCNGNIKACINQNGQGSPETYSAQDFIIGQIYYLRIYNVSGSSTNPFYVCIQSQSVSNNDLCANAINLVLSDSCNFATGSFNGSTVSDAAPQCAQNSMQDVWYKFVANNPVVNLLLNTTNNLNIGFELLDSICSGNSIACVNDYGVGVNEYFQTQNLKVGQTYYVRVFNVSGVSSASFNICVSEQPTYISKLHTIPIKVYPIPSNHIIKIIGYDLKNNVFAIYDLLNRKVLEGTLINNQIDISELKQGMYILKLKELNESTFFESIIVKN